MSDELKPCPFCGSDKVLVIGMADKPLDCYRWHVECQECHCTGRRFYRAEGARREMAVAAWNRRAPGASVPVTEIKTLLYVLEAWHRYNSGGDIPSHIELRDMAIVKDWLDAQVKQEDSESE